MYQDASFSEPLADSRQNKNSTITHFFIKRLHDIEIDSDRKYVFFGRQVDLIKIAGVLTNIERTSAVAHYQIADHTGEIRCNYFKDGKNTDDDPEVKLGSHVIACGTLRSGNDGSKEIACLRIEQINEYHILLHQRLSAIGDAALYEKLSKGMSLAVAMGNPGRELAASLASQQILDGYNGSSTSNMGGFNFDKPLKNKLMTMIGACNDPLGITRQAIQKAMPHINHKELSDSLQFLSSEGYLYTTVTDDHFQMTGR